ncbi:hypothetical protein [Gibbsiella quercinecans]|uniref:hypothetical protein n=1 Tax=Enterobacterales TaxID=91347 RepID=UPI000BAFF6D4
MKGGKSCPKKNSIIHVKNRVSDWVTIREAVKLINKTTGEKLKDSDIYRHALHGRIYISIYFPSPVILRKIKTINQKLKLAPVENSFISRLCFLDKKGFITGENLTFSTEGRYIYPIQRVIDTTLSGFEFVLIQRLLASSLKIPLPLTGANVSNYGITVTLGGDTFQIFEKMTWQEKINQGIMQLPENCLSEFFAQSSSQVMYRKERRGYFPIHNLPEDACFVIRHAELEKLINMSFTNKTTSPSATRISTPLSRLFWLACKHNKEISPLMRQPYKLLSIFEQWASDDGITDRLSGDTLKTALERGSPSSSSSSK